MQGNDLDAFLDASDATVLADAWNTPGHGQFDRSFIPRKFDCHGIAAKGAHKCGQQDLCSIPEQELTDAAANEGFVKTTFVNPNNLFPTNTATNNPPLPPRTTHTRDDLLKVSFEHRAHSARTINLGGQPKQRMFPDANGSAASIVKWGRICKLDKEQQRAFEVFTGSFVLSFYNEATQPVGGTLGAAVRNKQFNDE